MAKMMLVLVVLLVTTRTSSAQHRLTTGLTTSGGYPPAKCERLSIGFCRGLGYNFTAMPNFIGHDTQLKAERRLEALMPLVHYNCSNHLRFFLCSVFAPVCSEHEAMQIPACKPLCLSVRRDCEASLKELDMPWPHMLDCNRFPDSGNTVCVQPPEVSLSEEEPINKDPQDAARPEQVDQSSLDASVNQTEEEEEDEDESKKKIWPAIQSIIQTKSPESPKLIQKCPANYVETPYVDVVSFSHYHIHAFMLVTSCVPKCGEDASYRIEDKRFTERWMIGWAWLCFVSTLFTLLTFWVEPKRFRYPERPIVFLALCHNLLAIAYIVRGAMGPENLSCAIQDDGPSYVPINDGVRSMPCTLWWMARYYLGLASSLWWAILCGCWLLSARNEWSSEALHNISGYLHALAWGLPVLLTGATLITRNISADELTGLCQVKDESALWLEVLPNTSLLLLGCVLGGFAGAALVRVRRAIREHGRSATKLERLMSRLSIFAVLYALPAFGNFACVLHEAQIRPQWKTHALLTALDCNGNLSDCMPASSYKASGLEVALLRLFLSLVIGVTSGMWVWSSKTCRAWSRVLAAPSKQPSGCRSGHLHNRLPHHSERPLQGFKHDIVDIA